MSVTIIFTCPRCRLMTPGTAHIPDDVEPTRRITLENTCTHCDRTLIRRFKSVAHVKRECEVR